MIKPGLYCIATPIGNLQDMTFRAIETLKQCQIIACEDTRVSKKLLSHYGINTSLWAYHDHNAQQVRPKLIHAILQGNAVALISDAGTPLINDPGAKLVKQCQENKLFITTLPGPCSVISGLVLSGLTSHAFSFLGFFHAKKAQEWTHTPGTLVFFEAPHRLLSTLAKMSELFPNRDVAVVREITKMFEETVKGDFEAVIRHFESNEPRGEIVIVLGQKIKQEEIMPEILISQITQSLKYFSLKDTVESMARLHNISKKEIYNICLQIKKDD